MSIGGMMRTSVSGMGAQSSRLGTISTNIANSSTIGYKAVETQFSTMILGGSRAHISSSGGVETTTRNGISRQGVLQASSSPFDLAIRGNGFMLVSDPSGSVALTRAGAFVQDSNGRLVNAAGYTLMGFPTSGPGAAPVVVNGTAGLQPVTLSATHLEALPTSSGRLATNLPSAAEQVAAGSLPADNSATSTSSARTSIVVYDNLGEQVVLDVHYARSTTTGEWQVAVFNSADRSASGGFPYASGPLAQMPLNFDASGQLTTSPPTLSISVPGGATMSLSFEETSQLATGFSVLDVKTDGNPPGTAELFEIGEDGTIFASYPNGERRPVYVIPLATVVSPDNLTPKSGNVFEASNTSGDLRIGTPGSGSLGGLISGALENSTVDMAAELTDMIEAQRNYTANSRVFQTGSELMEVLINLKR